MHSTHTHNTYPSFWITHYCLGNTRWQNVVVVGETYFAVCFYIRSRFARVKTSARAREEELYTWCAHTLSLFPSLLSLAPYVHRLCEDEHSRRRFTHRPRRKGERGVQRQTRSLRSAARQIKRTKVRVLDFEFRHRLRKRPSMARFKRALCFISFSPLSSPVFLRHFAI